MKEIIKVTFIAVMMIVSSVVMAQSQKKKDGQGKKRCCTVENERLLQQQYPDRARESQFESWLAPFVDQVKKESEYAQFKKASRVISIPVVVHVIHNGQDVGVSPNIADEQVLSQLQVLNQDFRRMLGTSGYNDNPVGADVEIEFCTAKRTPDGLPTDGIDRVNTGVEMYTSMSQVEEMKPGTIWDPTRYLNIWVVNIGGTEGGWPLTFGYAQMPSVSELSGLNETDGTARTEGVVIRFNTFGSKEIYPGGDYMDGIDLGRTATHEVGHWLGLRHIWGDGGCGYDDYCADTPRAAAENYFCPNDSAVDSCPDFPGNDMVENYMDYSFDSCMNTFTKDQKYRMVAVMHNAIRRSSLRQSDACLPLNLETEGGIDLQRLNLVNCSSRFAPSIALKNYGTKNITDAVIQYSVDNENVQVFNWEGVLAKDAVVNINLPELTASSGVHTFYASLISVNGIQDAYAGNNELGKEFMTSIETNQLEFTLQLDYYGSETTWVLKNSTGKTLYLGGPYKNKSIWQTTVAPIVKTWDLPANDCYTFTIKDSADDGITRKAGFYVIKVPAGITVARSGNFKSSESHSFFINTLAGDEINLQKGEWKIYPNPAKDILNIEIPNALELPDSFMVYNSLGQLVLTKDKILTTDLTIDIGRLSKGVYIIKIGKDGIVKTIRFIKD